MRKIAEFSWPNGNKTKVYRNAEWEEWVVKFYNSQGVHMDASDYHTNDKQDALDTARPR